MGGSDIYRMRVARIRISRSPAGYHVLEYKSTMREAGWGVLERTDDLAALELIKAQVLMGVHPDIKYIGEK